MVDEVGAEDLVPPVEGVGGLEEEALVAIVVHEAASQLGWVSRSARPNHRIDHGR
jgi:hypothetical protein